MVSDTMHDGTARAAGTAPSAAFRSATTTPPACGYGGCR
jgi:hypothetical protein